MDWSTLNWLAIIVATFVPMVIGSLWYGPLFGKMWMGMMGLTEEEIKENLNAGLSYGGSTVGAFLTALVMALLLANTSLAGVGGGLCLGFACWAGFAVPIGFQAVAWESKTMALYTLNQAHNLVTFVAMAILLGIWS